MYTTFYALGVIGGVMLFAGAFTKSARVGPRWIRRALWMTGPASVVWGVLGYSVISGLVRDPYGLVWTLKTTFGGISIGILCLLFASGEFRTSPKTNDNRL